MGKDIRATQNLLKSRSRFGHPWHRLYGIEIHREMNVWSAAERRKRAKDLILRLGLNETIDQLAIENCVLVLSYVDEKRCSCL